MIEPNLTCNYCHCEKPNGEFNKGYDYATTGTGRCKKCCAEYNKKYYATPKGWANKVYASMKFRAENHSGKDKSYANIYLVIDHDEFVSWAVPKYIEFVAKYPNDRPSIDRINPDGHYSLNNIRILPWRENSRLARRKLARRYKAQLGLPWRRGKNGETLSERQLLEVSPVLITPNKFAQKLRKQNVAQSKPYVPVPSNDKFPWEVQ